MELARLAIAWAAVALAAALPSLTIGAVAVIKTWREVRRREVG